MSAASERRVGLLVGRSFAYGALLFGGSISVVHVIYNGLPFVQDAFVLWLTLGLLFGLPAAGTTALLQVVHRITRGRAHETQKESLISGLTKFVDICNACFFAASSILSKVFVICSTILGDSTKVSDDMI